MTYRYSILKRNCELVIMFPFVILGKLAGKLFPLKTTHDIFLFFPWADIGGSIKVNSAIAKCIKHKKPLIIFSKKPNNNQFRHLFDIEGVRVIDLHKYIDHKLIHFVNFFFRGVLSSWINKSASPVAFGGESIFFYKIIPHVRKETKIIELCHLNTWFNFSKAYIEYMDTRIFSTQKLKRDIEKLYHEDKIPQVYFEKLFFVDNKVDIPPYQEVSNSILQVLFAGRGAPQKRVHLIAAMAKRMHETGIPVHFSFVGDVENILPPSVIAYCTLYGNVNDDQTLHQIYRQSDVLLLTSEYEGLPLAVMEMMACGKIIVSTAVDGIPDYITHRENGLLITETDESKIIESGIALLSELAAFPALRKKIGKESYQYALNHFSGNQFCTFYNRVLTVIKEQVS